MHVIARIICAALAAAAILFNGVTQGAGEYQGWEPLPAVVDIRFNRDAIGFTVARNGYVPGGPRHFELPRNATDWRRITAAEFHSRFPSRNVPASVYVRDRRNSFEVLSTSDGEHFISTDFQCMEGSYHWAGLRRNGDWLPTGFDTCVNVSAVERSGPYLLLGSSLVGEASMFFGAQGISVFDERSGELEKRIGYSENLYADGMIRTLRRDPFTGEVWASTLRSLWQLDANLDLARKYFFADVFDHEAGRTRTRLTDNAKATDHLAQYVRAMGINNPAAVYNHLDVRREQKDPFSLMYALGMSNAADWSAPEMQVLLPYFMEAAAPRGEAGKWNVAFLEELATFTHPCVSNAGTALFGFNSKKKIAAGEKLLECLKVDGLQLPPPPAPVTSDDAVTPQAPNVPAQTHFGAPPREGRLHDEKGSAAAWANVHAAWFAWQGGLDEQGRYEFKKRCVDFETLTVGNDGYYRFDARRFKRDGDWVGAETLYAVSGEHWRLESRRYSMDPPEYFDLPPGKVTKNTGQPDDARSTELAETCLADGVDNAHVQTVLEETLKARAQAKAAREAASAARRQHVPIVQLMSPVRGNVAPGETTGTFTLNLLFMAPFEPGSLRATLLGADISEHFNVAGPGVKSVELSAPPGRHEITITARREGATATETYTFAVNMQTSAEPSPRVAPIEVTVRPVEFDPNRPRVPILKPEISVQRIEIQREPAKKEEGEGDQRP